MTEAKSGVNCDTCQCRNGYSEIAWKIPDLKWQSNFCPVQQVLPWSWYMLQLHRLFCDGHLPVSGGVTDQPAKVMEAFRIIAERRAYNSEKAKPHGKKAAR